MKKTRFFEVGMIAYLISIFAGVVYILWSAASFFPALRQVEFQFAPRLSAGDGSGYSAFMSDAVMRWPDILKAQQATWSSAIAISIAILLLLFSFALQRTKLKGRRFEEEYPGALAGQRLARVRDLTGFTGELYIRDDLADYAESASSGIYLPRNLAQRLDLKSDDSAVSKVAFTICHEAFHSRSFDNLLWSFGRTVTTLLTGVAGLFLIQIIVFGVTMMLRMSAGESLPFPVAVVVDLLVTSVILSLVGLSISGATANLASVREYFADHAAALKFGLESLPYARVNDPQNVGRMTDAWRRGVSSPDRRLHALGISPKLDSFVACVIGLWVTLRTTALIVGGSSAFGVTGVFDLVCLTSVAVMTWSLPRPVRGVRRYGKLPWLVLISWFSGIIVMLVSSRIFFSEFGITQIFSTGLISMIALPPVVVSSCGLAWLRLTASDRSALDVIDITPARAMQKRAIPLLLFAIPSFVLSYFIGGGVVFVPAASLLSFVVALFGNLAGFQLAALANGVILLMCVLILIILAKNLDVPSLWSAALEVLLVSGVGGLLFYGSIVSMGLAQQKAPGDSGDPVDYFAVLDVMGSFPAAYVVPALCATGLLAAVHSLSWVARYQLVKSDSR